MLYPIIASGFLFGLIFITYFKDKTHAKQRQQQLLKHKKQIEKLKEKKKQKPKEDKTISQLAKVMNITPEKVNELIEQGKITIHKKT